MDIFLPGANQRVYNLFLVLAFLCMDLSSAVNLTALNFFILAFLSRKL